MSCRKVIGFILITPVFVLLSHYLAVYPHEFSHSFMAWALGFKHNPLAIDFGGTSWLNILLLINIDENVNYQFLISHGHLYAMALIAFAGPGLANGLLYVISLILLNLKSLYKHKIIYYFIFWFNFMNLCNFYDYIPIRTLTNHGDVAHFSTGLGVSPWWVYLIGGYIVFMLIWFFFTRTLMKTVTVLNFSESFTIKLMLSILCIALLFGYFALPGILSNYGQLSFLISISSISAIPGVIFAAWPARSWVKQRLEFYASKVKKS
ncbi:MAG: hypothetical protein EP298_11750 [Gammaproteobacteria bacterium]|nr:MAG: hypothetical protein EP298_11750 [Gammaproteobacteria bacterium]UTW42069.1 hypothetical protein KFE69_11270 [bacterium SCSIO 12844]